MYVRYVGASLRSAPHIGPNPSDSINSNTSLRLIFSSGQSSNTAIMHPFILSGKFASAPDRQPRSSELDCSDYRDGAVQSQFGAEILLLPGTEYSRISSAPNSSVVDLQRTHLGRVVRVNRVKNTEFDPTAYMATAGLGVNLRLIAKFTRLAGNF